ncbi:MAG TPA: pyruvate kinase [Thiobacillaceae bacterium]|nr:pyruvate kinase [Thiobacillaceae bacterium]
MPLPIHHITDTLIPALETLRQQALELEHSHRGMVERVLPRHQDSARNLLHYLALRQSDLRELQQDLSLLGLSRLGRAEAHALSSIDAVLDALRALAGVRRNGHRSPTSVDITTGAMHLNEHAKALLGSASGKRATRIMVTMPSEAATDPDLARRLLVAGMDIMRINCAHDDAEAWQAMIRHLRAAEAKTGRSCRVYADLAGPKLRTGPIRPVGRLTEFKTRRDVWGRVTTPARVWLTPRDQPEQPPIEVDTVLPIDDTLMVAVHAGDTLDVDDTRGSRRHLIMKERFGDSWLAHCHQRAYIGDGAECRLYRGDELLLQGTVGPLPEVFQPIVLKAGDTLLLTRGETPGAPAEADDAGRAPAPARIPCTLDAVFDSAHPGQAVWFDDGKIGGRIQSNLDGVITVEITQAAPVGSKLRAEKGINLPDTDLDIPALTAKDLADLETLAPHVDIVGLSFVRAPGDVLALQDQMRRLGAAHLGTVLKIETRQGFENLPMILLASLRHPAVGVMVARGDLAVEVGFERLAEVQEEILWLCEAAHIPVIWATQVLESMAKRGIPSRAEVSDAALAVRAECVMLNKGPYIVETVDFLDGVLERMSGHQVKRRPVSRRLAVSRLPAEV